MNISNKQNYRWILIMAVLAAACNNDPKPVENNPSSNEPANTVPIASTITYDIVNQFPHDPAAFTEGLEFRDDFLYESIGQYKKSAIRKVDLKTGKVLLETKMEPRYFGEGMTLLNGKIYQLTYREGKGFIYDASSLKQIGTFQFSAPEGWGMTNNGTSLIYNDGSNTFHFIDPSTFKETKKLMVTDEHGPVNELNEPELIHGFIYANQWRTETILKIDTATGRVVGRADLTGIRERLGIPPMSNNPAGPDVLNGIAYDPATNRIFITGKNWPKLVEIKLDN